MKTGTANLPLHGGKCPAWLFERMKKLGTSMVEAMLLEFSRHEVLRRLSDPGWFQAFGCVLGFDWHSSGLTTVLCGALKEGLNPRAHELGIYVTGGKGAESRNTPREISEYADNEAPELPVSDLQYSSRMAAQVDSCAVQDAYQIYHHSFFLTCDGNWSVVQQGINESTGWARRYHWIDDEVDDYIEEPHAAISSSSSAETLNLTDVESRENRDVSVEVASDDPVGTIQEFQRLLDYWDEDGTLDLPARHEVPRVSHLKKALGRIYKSEVEGFADMLDLNDVGPKTIRALSMVSEVVWGATPSYEDPVRYSFAHGGKDGYPYPVDRMSYDKTIEVLNTAIDRARVGRSEKMKAFKRLNSLEDELKSGRESNPDHTVNLNEGQVSTESDTESDQLQLDM